MPLEGSGGSTTQGRAGAGNAPHQGALDKYLLQPSVATQLQAEGQAQIGGGQIRARHAQLSRAWRQGELSPAGMISVVG